MLTPALARGEKVHAQGEPIIPGMDKPNHVFNGVMLCGDCGRPLTHVYGTGQRA
jgi:hypothetical protein